MNTPIRQLIAAAGLSLTAISHTAFAEVIEINGHLDQLIFAHAITSQSHYELPPPAYSDIDYSLELITENGTIQHGSSITLNGSLTYLGVSTIPAFAQMQMDFTDAVYTLDSNLFTAALNNNGSQELWQVDFNGGADNIGDDIYGNPTPISDNRSSGNISCTNSSNFCDLYTLNQLTALSLIFSRDAITGDIQLLENRLQFLNQTGVISHVLASEVPLPAAGWLFGSAVLGLIARTRRTISVQNKESDLN